MMDKVVLDKVVLPIQKTQRANGTANLKLIQILLCWRLSSCDPATMSAARLLALWLVLRACEPFDVARSSRHKRKS